MSLPDSPRHDDRRGILARSSQERIREHIERPLTTEKMLSANGEMSNIFLQKGQNIDITHKKRIKRASNFGRRGGLTVYLR
jgi:hypothetical protein